MESSKEGWSETSVADNRAKKPPVLHYYQLAGSSSDRSSVVITVNGFLQVFLIVGKHVQKRLSQGGVMLAHRL